MIAKSLRMLSLAAALAGLSMVAAAEAKAQTDEGDGDEGRRKVEQSAPMRDYADRQRRRFDALSASGSPRDWALASLMPPFEVDWTAGADRDATVEKVGKVFADRAVLLRNAAAAAPDDGLVQWLALYDMPNGSGGCASSSEPAERVDAVQRLEPDNALAWVPTLRRAVNAKDAVGIDTTLARMAAAARFDNHARDYALALLDADKRFPDSAEAVAFGLAGLSGDAMRFMTAVGFGEAIGASLHVVDDVCDAGKHVDADVRRFAACADLGRRASRESPAVSLRHWGFGMLRKSASFDTADETAERELKWLEAQVRGNGDSSFLTTLDEIKGAWLAEKDDVAALRRVLEKRGVSVVPPIGWVPPVDSHADTADGGE